jgi:hypothetical protein
MSLVDFVPFQQIDRFIIVRPGQLEADFFSLKR